MNDRATLNSDAYEELIRVIAKSRHGISREEIEKNIKHTQKGGTLSKRLQDLERTGFIKEFLPFGHAKKGLYYRVVDEYCLFYLQWIEPKKHNIELEIDGNSFWLEIINSPHYQAWRGYAFESVCYKHVAKIKKALGIKTAAKIGTWRLGSKSGKENQGAQIDLLFDRSDNALNLCEIKYSDNPFVIDKQYAKSLNEKIEIFKITTNSKKQIFLNMIAANGLKQNAYSQEMVASIITIDDLINGP